MFNVREGIERACESKTDEQQGASRHFRWDFPKKNRDREAIFFRFNILETTTALVNLLISLGCVDTNPLCSTININNPGTITAS